MLSAKLRLIRINHLHQIQKQIHIPTKTILLCVWLDCAGIIYHELLKPNLTITADSYVQQVQTVQNKLQSDIFLHDNARSNTTWMSHESIFQVGWAVLLDPPYFRDLALTDYCLFWFSRKTF